MISLSSSKSLKLLLESVDSVSIEGDDLFDEKVDFVWVLFENNDLGQTLISFAESLPIRESEF